MITGWIRPISRKKCDEPKEHLSFAAFDLCAVDIDDQIHGVGRAAALFLSSTEPMRIAKCF
jgi:hypothetical protein